MRSWINLAVFFNVFFSASAFGAIDTCALVVRLGKVLVPETYSSPEARKEALERFGKASARSHVSEEVIRKFYAIAWGDAVSQLPVILPSAIKNLRRVKDVVGTNHDEMYEGTLLGLSVLVKVEKVNSPDQYDEMIYEAALGQLFNKAGEGPVMFGLTFLDSGRLGIVMEKVEGVHLRDLGKPEGAALRSAPVHIKNGLIDRIRELGAVFVEFGIIQRRQADVEVIFSGLDVVVIDFGGQQIDNPDDRGQASFQLGLQATRDTFERIITDVKKKLSLR